MSNRVFPDETIIRQPECAFEKFKSLSATPAASINLRCNAKRMPAKNIDLHGSAPDKHKFALLLIDVINDFDFPEADQLLKYERPRATHLFRLNRHPEKAGVPVIYVNYNFGRWKSDFRRTVDHCARHGRGRDVVKLLRPEKSDYFVLKP